MIEKAIEKIQKEIQRGTPAIVYIGQWLIERCCSEEAAKKILQQNKTITGALDKIRDEAEKVKMKNVAVLTSDEALPIVAEYYGLDNAAAATVEQTHSAVVDLNLDDLL